MKIERIVSLNPTDLSVLQIKCIFDHPTAPEADFHMAEAASNTVTFQNT